MCTGTVPRLRLNSKPNGNGLRLRKNERRLLLKLLRKLSGLRLKTSMSNTESNSRSNSLTPEQAKAYLETRTRLEIAIENASKPVTLEATRARLRDDLKKIEE